jgi:integrase/recombinase XerD
MKRTSVKMQTWPEADRAMWEQAIKKGCLLDEKSACANWARETRRVMARDYGYWLSFLMTTDRSATQESPAIRITPDRVRSYCNAMRDVSALTRASRIARLHALIAAADPARDLSWLAAIRRGLDRLARREGPARSKHGRVVATGRLIDAGLNLLKRARCDHRRSLQLRARDFRDGLMIALLAARPLRIKNFAALQMGQHIKPTSSGYLIDVAAEETKTGHPIETFVPEDLCPWLSIYLKEYRPYLLCGRESDYLWVHKTGNSYRPGSLSQRITKLTARNLGIAISPHLFRDCAATTIATDDPEHVLIIAAILGHTTLKTAEIHYNHAQGLEANRHFQNSIKSLRGRALRISRRPQRA